MSFGLKAYFFSVLDVKFYPIFVYIMSIAFHSGRWYTNIVSGVSLKTWTYAISEHFSNSRHQDRNLKVIPFEHVYCKSAEIEEESGFYFSKSKILN